ncbi:LysR substrate-binding domain-containing protein [Vibrio sp. VB16]|uniref:LysR substrate-binding domain-containing protein n=1 Tax=Vibrio sp. VB16 TaxID=2785746 RepID=UPI00189D0C87|nr:LysR substrate-binding domain-containing protein [Vibrio sp. VB16]UGA55861.1 LysR substrate-binding domain-containing protein [Vibrio sp. VB16]
MDKLKSMQVFVYVVEHGTFSSAAVHFSITATMIGKHIKQLEKQLGTQLITRTTRKQSLTESGQLYYSDCKRILEEITNVENKILTVENRPKGTVRINAPVTYGSIVLAPIVADFLKLYPEINIELTLDNLRIDPILDQVDIIIRIGHLNDSALIARPLGQYEMIFSASPKYLSTYGIPSKVKDLVNHHCLGFHYGDIQSHQASRLGTHAFDKTNIRLSSNNGYALKVAALQGLGIMLQPKISLTSEITDQSLIQILDDESPTSNPIHVLYKSKFIPIKTRTFVDYLLECTV